MTRRLARPVLVLAAAGLALALAVRLHNAFRYPLDWGFDASFNIRYIYYLTKTWSLPDPDAGWATADPPLFFAVSAWLVRRLEPQGTLDQALRSVPLLSTLAGLGVAVLAFALVRRADPGHTGRALLAAALVLFLPAHLYMSAMINEEMLTALFTSLALYAVSRAGLAAGEPGPERWRAAGAGLAAGLATLSKLTGSVAALAAAGAYLLEGLRRTAVAPAVQRALLLLTVALLSGGWYYARNVVKYGYVQPHGLSHHRIMFRMPPGERSVFDYLRLPLATFTDPQALDPQLLRSVWGSTYASVWFDTQRHFLARDDPTVRRLGSVVLVLGLLPTAAFGLGLVRGLRRALRTAAGPDAPLLLFTGLTLAGYTYYTWRNPWFAVVKGTSLLGLCLPYAYYTSETLARWLRIPGPTRWCVGSGLAALTLAVTLVGTFDLVVPKTEIPGLDWQAAAPP